MIGVILLLTILIALGIASYWSRNENASLGQFFARLVGAWILVALTVVVLVYGAFAMVFGGAYCINC
jgi:hypothetical protein